MPEKVDRDCGGSGTFRSRLLVTAPLVIFFDGPRERGQCLPWDFVTLGSAPDFAKPVTWWQLLPRVPSLFPFGEHCSGGLRVSRPRCLFW